MTIDERLDRLTERHESLDAECRNAYAIVNDIAVGTAQLLHVVEAHEHRLDRHGERLDRLEGQ